MNLLAASREVSFVIPSVSEESLADASSNHGFDFAHHMVERLPRRFTPRNDTRRKRRGITSDEVSLREIK